MNIEDVLNKDLVIMLDTTAKNAALSEMITLITNTNQDLDPQELNEKLFYRESLMSTGVGLGLAVPHVRLEGVKQQIVAVGLSSKGIDDYESVDDEQIHLVVMIVGPKGEHKQHISLLANIVSLFKDNERKQSILSAHRSEELYAALKG